MESRRFIAAIMGAIVLSLTAGTATAQNRPANWVVKKLSTHIDGPVKIVRSGLTEEQATKVARELNQAAPASAPYFYMASGPRSEDLSEPPYPDPVPLPSGLKPGGSGAAPKSKGGKKTGKPGTAAEPKVQKPSSQQKITIRIFRRNGAKVWEGTFDSLDEAGKFYSAAKNLGGAFRVTWTPPTRSSSVGATGSGDTAMSKSDHKPKNAASPSPAASFSEIEKELLGSWQRFDWRYELLPNKDYRLFIQGREATPKNATWRVEGDYVVLSGSTIKLKIITPAASAQGQYGRLVLDSPWSGEWFVKAAK